MIDLITKTEYDIYSLGFDKLLSRALTPLVLGLESELPVPSYLTSDFYGVSPSLLASGELTGNLSMVSGYLKSSNFVSGSSGWRILSTGDVEFNSGTFRGSLIAGSIHIPDQNTTFNSFHTDTYGNSWWGCPQTSFNLNPNNAVAYVLKTGVAKFTKITITGGADVSFISDTFDTQTKQILGDFTFGASGAIKMFTDANNGLWISPTGILGKKAGTTTFAIDISGNATFAGTLIAAAGTLGTITAGTLAGVTITGGTIQTATSGERIEMSGSTNKIIFYDSGGQSRIEIGGTDILYFRDAAGAYGGLLQATTEFRIAGAKNLSLEAGSGYKITFNRKIEPTTSANLGFGTSDKRIGIAHFGDYIYSWYTILPHTDYSYSSLGESSRYWCYLWAKYVRYKDLAAFQEHDDIALIKNIKDKTIKRIQVDGYDKDKKPIKREEEVRVWDEETMPPEVYKDGFYDAGAVQGFAIGALKKIIEKVEQLESKVK